MNPWRWSSTLKVGDGAPADLSRTRRWSPCSTPLSVTCRIELLSSALTDHRLRSGSFPLTLTQSATQFRRLLQTKPEIMGPRSWTTLYFQLTVLKQPPEYRRAILLISDGRCRKPSETRRGITQSQQHEHDDLRSCVLSIKDYAKQEGPKTFGRGPIPGLYSKSPVPPGPAHGCMSRDANDPQVDLSKSPTKQTYDCLSLLAPPLRLATIATVAVSDGLKKNVPETVSRLTSGEYFKLIDEANLEHSLQTIANHLPNRYILSFQPEAPHPGFHSLLLHVRGYDGLQVSARDGYGQNARTLEDDRPYGRPPPD
jgi:hypothetical protein